MARAARGSQPRSGLPSRCPSSFQLTRPARFLPCQSPALSLNLSLNTLKDVTVAQNQRELAPPFLIHPSRLSKPTPHDTSTASPQTSQTNPTPQPQTPAQTRAARRKARAHQLQDVPNSSARQKGPRPHQAPAAEPPPCSRPRRTSKHQRAPEQGEARRNRLEVSQS